MIKKKNSKNTRNNFTKFSGMAFQMLITILVGVYIGQYLDKEFPNDSSVYTLIFSLIFIGASLYTVIRQAIKLGNDE